MKTISSSLILLFAFAGAALSQSASETAKIYLDLIKRGEYRQAVGFIETHKFQDLRALLKQVESMPKEEAKMVCNTIFRAQLDLLSTTPKVQINRITVLGEVPEGDKIAHVVTRISASAARGEMDAVAVLSLKQTKGKWKVLLSGRAEIAAIQIGKALRAQERVLQRQQRP